MKLAFLDRKNDRQANSGCAIDRDGATLRLVEQPAHVRSWEPVVIHGGDWPREPEQTFTGGVDVRAEITTKRFAGNQVSQDRYEATLQAFDGSPSSLIAALSAACAGIDDFRAVNGTDERVILQINLIR
jgi:hypothetical protein